MEELNRTISNTNEDNDEPEQKYKTETDKNDALSSNPTKKSK